MVFCCVFIVNLAVLFVMFIRRCGGFLVMVVLFLWWWWLECFCGGVFVFL